MTAFLDEPPCFRPIIASLRFVSSADANLFSLRGRDGRGPFDQRLRHYSHLSILYFYLHPSQRPVCFGHHDVPSRRKRNRDRVVIHRGIVVFLKKLTLIIIELNRTTDEDRAFFIWFVIAFTVDN